MYERLFLAALTLSILCECAATLVFVRLARVRIAISRVLLVCAGGTLLTLPYVWFVLPPFLPGQSVTIYTEAFAVAVEALLYARLLPLPAGKALLLSLAANSASYGFGRMTAAF